MAPFMIEVASTDTESSATSSSGSPSLGSEQYDFEPIAIVGMACRWPGEEGSGKDLDTPQAFWDFLDQRKNAYGDFPASRLNVDAWHHPTVNRPGSFYTRGGAFLKEDVRDFDPTFFGINASEAMSLDPAQRKFLEVVYEALESSGTSLESVSGSKTGCFVGNFNYDHQLMQYRDTEYPEAYGITGGGIALLSNRVNYVFNLQGPSLTLDTACSSSMYALHLACNAIHSGECDAAIVGGSNLILTPECQVFSSALGAVSKSSICHTFDAAADGYARADGIGALYVKPLRRAIQDDDPIRAIIRGTAINANGKTGGITHPDPDGQEKAIRRAYQRARLDPSLTTYFEFHGTGTQVGDPLETEAVGRVFASKKTTDHPLLIGSVKSNMGHCESASGVAGLMKSVLALEHGAIPPIRALDHLNPNVDLRSGKLKIVQEKTVWPTEGIRRASVNSFGYGGANAHVIVEGIESLAPGRGGVKAHKSRTSLEVPEELNSQFSNRAVMSRRTKYLLPFSAHNSRTLERNIDAHRLAADNWDLLDLAYTLSCRRSTFATRSFVVASADNVIEALTPSNMVTHKSAGSQKLSLGFVFTGQGAQWPQMGLDLMESFPTYLRSIREMDDILHCFEGCPTWTLEETLRAGRESSLVYKAEFSQTLVTAIQVALVDLLASWDVRPAVTVGHSSGEIAAAYASGSITAAEAILTAYTRGQAVSRNQSSGCMLAVGASVDQMSDHLNKFQNIGIACYNSPESLTISGDGAEITALKNLLDAEGVFARMLATDGNAYHSYHMKTIARSYEDELDNLLQRLKPMLGNNNLPPAAFISSVTAKKVGKPVFSASYWRANLESPVLFSQAVTNLVQTQPVDHIIEIGPHSALQGPLRQIFQTLPDKKLPGYIPTLIRNSDGAEDLLKLAGTLFCKGHKVDIKRANTVEALDYITNSVLTCSSGTTIVDLPKYQWTYGEQIYFENRWTREWRLRTHPRHDILGSRTPGGNAREPTWRNVLRQKDLPWLEDHKIGRDTIFPASGYLSMAIEAAIQLAEINNIDSSTINAYELRDVSIDAALIIPESGGVEVLLGLHPTRLNKKSYYANTYDFTITSVNQVDQRDVFTEHARGQITFTISEQNHRHSLNINFSNNKKPILSSMWYDAFAQVGLQYGRTFRGLSDIQIDDKCSRARSHVNLIPTADIMSLESRYIIHPAALDSILQLAIIAGKGGRATKLATGYLPVSMDKLSISTPKEAYEECVGAAQAASSSAQSIVVDATLTSHHGEQILTATGITLKASDVSSSLPSTARDFYTSLVWRPDATLFTTSTFQSLYPSSNFDADISELALLDQVALLQTIQFHTKHPEFFSKGSSEPHLQRLLSWMAHKVDVASKGGFTNGVRAIKYSIQEREEEIERLEQILLKDHGPETRIMCHMYRSLPAIYRGEISGIHAAVQDHLLDDLYEHMRVYHDGSVALRDLIVQLCHKDPSMKILEVGGGTGSATKEVLPALNAHTDLRGFDSYTFTDIGAGFLAAAQDAFRRYAGVEYATYDMQLSASAQGLGSDYDLIIASNVVHATSDIHQTLKNIRSLLKPGGKLVLFEFVRPLLSWNIILGTFSDFWKGDKDPTYPRNEGPFMTRAVWNDVLPKSGFTSQPVMLDHFTQRADAAVIMATASEEPPVSAGSGLSRAISVIYRDVASTFVEEFVQYLESHGVSTDLVPLSQASQRNGGRAVFLVEVDSPLLFDVDTTEWSHLKKSLLGYDSILYVTRGGLLSWDQPSHAIMSGITCAIHTEKLSSKLVTIDLDHEGVNRFLEFEMLDQLEQRAADYMPGGDFEYRCRDGVVHVSRLEIDQSFTVDLAEVDNEAVLASMSLAEVQTKNMVLSESSPSLTTCFEEVQDSNMELNQDEVEVEMRAADLSALHPPSMVNKLSNHFSGGFAGVVARVGSSVSSIKPGDRVFGLTSSRLGTFTRTTESLCLAMGPDDRFEDLASLGPGSCMALYAFFEAGRLEEGDRILIDPATGVVGMAAYQIAKHAGAEVYVAAELGTETVFQAVTGISNEFCYDVKESVCVNKYPCESGSGFKFILSCAQGEMMHQYWQCIAPYGYFIDLSRNEALDNGHLQMSKFAQNATFSSFDLTSLRKNRPDKVAELLRKMKLYYEAGALHSLANKTVAVSNVDEIASGRITDYAGTVLTFDPFQDSINILPSPEKFIFDAQASYVLVGCLGGLGCSFATWMAKRGARQITFLSRSGASSQEAQALLQTLTSLSVEVQVVKGDVSSHEDVTRAIEACPYPVKGVVQAALTLHDSFFEEMSHNDFHATLDPRVKGTLNLHHATLEQPLDFFLLWSSWTTIFGSTSQGNYMAANAFMDSFAAWRRAQDLPAASLGLGQILDVGVVSGVSAYQEHLHRMGLHGVDEDAFLRSCEAALMNQHRSLQDAQPNTPINASHILTGVDPAVLLSYAERYPPHDMSWYSDPRFGRLVQSVKHLASSTASQSGLGLAADQDDPNEEPAERIHKKLARLLFIPREDIDTQQPIKNYGIDSMVAAELRNWVFGALGQEVSVLKLLSPGTTVETLAAAVKDRKEST